MLFKEFIKCYSILVLLILIVIQVKRTGKSVNNQVKTGLEIASIIPVAIYLLNI